MDSPSEVLKLLMLFARLQIGSMGGRWDVIWRKVHNGRANSLVETLMPGKIEDKRTRGGRR